MTALRLAFASLRFRTQASALTVLSMALSVALYCTVESLRSGVRESFEETVSQTDLIVGARSSPLNLVLYTLFHLGDATNNIQYKTFQEIAAHHVVRWAIPISLGDSHRGFRVIATNESFYEHFQFRGDWHLEFREGKAARDVFEVVLGAEVAERLGYQVAQKIVLSHGMSSEKGSLLDHGDKPFTVVGILARSGTPLDRALFISLEGMEALHVDWQSGAPPDEGQAVAAANLTKAELQPKRITSFLLGLKSRVAVLHMQRQIQNYAREPLEAAIPGFVLSRFWETLSIFEKTLSAMTFAIFIVGLLAMLIALLSSLEQRRREMAVLRALGARARWIFSLLLLEAYVLFFAALATGFGIYSVIFFTLRTWIETRFGAVMIYWPFGAEDVKALGLVVAVTAFVSLLPAAAAYRKTLDDGLKL